MEPLSMWGSMFGFGSAVLPIDLGPGALPQLPRLTMPWPPLDGNRLIDIPVGNPQAQFSWIPGIFFPTNTPQFDTLVSYASARRAWGWDTDFNPNDPRTWGVQSNESHPRFTSALQLTVDNSQGYLGRSVLPRCGTGQPSIDQWLPDPSGHARDPTWRGSHDPRLLYRSHVESRRLPQYG